MRHYRLSILHESHLGIEKTKTRARQAAYWPGLMTDFENLMAYGTVCEKFRSLNSKEPLITHDISDIPFNKTGCDIYKYAGKQYLIIGDYFPK